jgi:DNA-binding MarR family transcriptional regulator
MQTRVPFLLYRTAQASHALANQMLAEIGLTARQVGILTLITEREPMTQTGLGGELEVDRTTMVELLDKLEERGLVERRRHPADRRAFVIHPTGAGLAAKEDAIRILDRQQAAFLEPLSQRDRGVLADLLNRLYANSRPRSGEM